MFSHATIGATIASIKKKQKSMKNILFILGLMLTLTLPACDIEDESPASYVTYGNITDISQGIKITNDSLFVLYSPTKPSGVDCKIGDRVEVVFTISSAGSDALGYNQKINITKLYTIQVKDVLQVNAAGRDTLKTADLTLSSMWIGNNYLNMEMAFAGSGKTHDFYVGYDPDEQNVNGKVVLRLYHDTNNDGFYQNYWTLRSFNLKSFEWTGTQPYKIVLRCNTSGKEKDYTLDYTPMTTTL